MQVNSHKASHNLYIIAWILGLLFYFLDYVIRSAPAVMIPQLSQQFNVTSVELVTLIGTYYYTYSTCSLIAGIALDRFGAKYSLFWGTFILGVGALLFLASTAFVGTTGRLLQGAGCAFAFPGCVYLASKGFSAKSLATAIGFTQCLGMLGGSAGQFVVAPLIENGLHIDTFWLVSGIATIIVAIGLAVVIPSQKKEASFTETKQVAPKKGGLLTPYKIVFSNPQSWLCGIISGLLFAPTTIFAMTWAVAFFQEDRAFDYHHASVTSAMVAFGWAFGCPILGYVTDKIGKRKPVLRFGALMMIASLVLLIYFPNLIPESYSMFLLGVGSGAAMIPYSVIKETNPDEVKGSSTGAINFITFSITTLLSPVFTHVFGKTLASAADKSVHFQQAGLFWVASIGLAIVLSYILKETGKGKAQLA